MDLKSKVGLVAAKASALRINLNIQGFSIVASPLHAPSRAPVDVRTGARHEDVWLGGLWNRHCLEEESKAAYTPLVY